MNTDKLIEAIQILVREEVKKQLPIIVTEILQSKKKPQVVELGTPKSKSKVYRPSMAKAILGEDYQTPKKSQQKQVQYSKNPMINEILNETKRSPSNSGEPTGYEEWPTMNNPMMNMSPTNSVDGMRTSMAEKMGYGEFASGVGLGVQTGNTALDKALNRNYSDLVKLF